MMKLAGSNVCPICGKEFTPTPPLRPNVKDKEFYGGRIKFFKEVECECTAKYDLCIEEKYIAGDNKLRVIDLIVLKEGVPLAQLRKEAEERARAEAEVKAVEAVHEAIEQKGDVPTLKQREDIKRQTILATILDKDTKIETLTTFTTKELRTMCKRRKLRYNANESKKVLAEKLLAYDPTMVVAHEE
jgi:hypothetical protein